MTDLIDKQKLFAYLVGRISRSELKPYESAAATVRDINVLIERGEFDYNPLFSERNGYVVKCTNCGELTRTGLDKMDELEKRIDLLELRGSKERPKPNCTHEDIARWLLECLPPGALIEGAFKIKYFGETQTFMMMTDGRTPVRIVRM